MIKIFLYVFLAEILTAAGQILFKRSANTLGAHDLNKADARFKFVSEALSKPGLWIGFVLMGIGLVAWLFALAEGDLSLVFPLGSMQYVLILFLAHFMLGEKIDRMKLMGTLLVVFGIVLITVTH